MEENSFNKYDDYDGEIGESEYSSKSDFSKGKLSYDCFVNCMNARSVEMRSGYFNTTISADGLPIKSWISDTRKKYWSSVQTLRRLLSPEILDAISTDKKKKKDESESKDNTKHKIEEIIEKMNNLFDIYCYKEKKSESKDNRIIYVDSGRKFMPQVDDTLKVIKKFPDGKQYVKEVRGAWNIYINAYWDEIVILSDRLLEELMKIVHNGNYFKSKIRMG